MTSADVTGHNSGCKKNVASSFFNSGNLYIPTLLPDNLIRFITSLQLHNVKQTLQNITSNKNYDLCYNALQRFYLSSIKSVIALKCHMIQLSFDKGELKVSCIGFQFNWIFQLYIKADCYFIQHSLFRCPAKVSRGPFLLFTNCPCPKLMALNLVNLFLRNGMGKW